MALAGAEHWSRGFVFSNAAETILASTTVVAGASLRNGLQRDQDGRLVTSAGPGAYLDGFVRDANGALVAAAGKSTPPLYPFA